VILAAIVLAWSQVPAPPQAAGAPPAPKPVEPYAGRLAAGRAELQALAARLGEGDDTGRAALFDLASSIEASARLATEPEAERARALFDAGVARGLARDCDGAATAFFAARGLAGSSALGLDAAYDAGTFRLQRAEELRLAIPEVREKLELPPLAPPAQPQQPGAAGEADPIAVARQAYLAAREPLVERLRADWRDVDTRANLELAARRLRELDQIERQRREEQQEQQQQQQDQDQKPDPDRDQQKSDDAKDERQESDGEKPQDQQQEEPDEKPQDRPPQEEEPDEKESEPGEAEPEERVLSKEEVLRLLDQLAEIEKQAEEVRAALRERRRTPVKRDW
jgi:hypothetical protein